MNPQCCGCIGGGEKCVRYYCVAGESADLSLLMHVLETEVAGSKCQLVYSKNKSTLSVSILSDDPVLGSNNSHFGVLVYALPHPTKEVVTSVLISSEDMLLTDSACLIASLIVSQVNRPVYLNTTVRSPDPLLLRDLKAVLQETCV